MKRPANTRGSHCPSRARITLSLIILWLEGACSQCTICKEGGEVSLPENVLTLPGFPNLSCGTVDTTLSLLISNASSSECNTVQSLGSLCGCPIRNDACSLCSDGTSASLPYNELPFLSDLFLGFTPTCQILESYLTSVGHDESLCFVAQSYISDYCGCAGTTSSSEETNNNPTPCTLCPLGEVASLPDKHISMDGFPFQTCRQLEDALNLLLVQESQECSLLSQAFAKLCGCSSAIPHGDGAGACVLCQDGSSISLPNETVDLFKDMFAGIAPTCEVYESFVAGFDASSQDCSNAQLFGSYCGCPAIPNHCEFCPGEEIPDEYADKVVDELDLLIGLKATCNDAAAYVQYQLPAEGKTCSLGQSYKHVCGCNDGLFPYLDADTKKKQAALAWAPRISGVISFLGSALIVKDILFQKSRRQKVYSQLVLGMSVFDIIGAIAWMFSTAPINSDFVYGAVGTEATCKIQGFAFQLGFTSIFYNVSLSTYYLLVIVHGWRDRRLKNNRWWLHGIPLVVGMVLAFCGLPFYQNVIFGCHVQNPPVFEDTWFPVVFFIFVPVFGAIFLTTVMMMLVLRKVRQQNRKASKWKFPSIIREGAMLGHGNALFARRDASEETPQSSPLEEDIACSQNTGARRAQRRRSSVKAVGVNASARLERQVFVQSVLYVSAFYVCWSFILAAHFEASPVIDREHYVYPFYVVCFIMAPLQGAWNAVIYFRPRLQSRSKRWRCCCSRVLKNDPKTSEVSDDQNSSSKGWSRFFARGNGGGSSELMASSGGLPSEAPQEVDPSILIADSSAAQTLESRMSSSSFNNDDVAFANAGSMSAIQEELAQLDMAEAMIEDFPGDEED